MILETKRRSHGCERPFHRFCVYDCVSCYRRPELRTLRATKSRRAHEVTTGIDVSFGLHAAGGKLHHASDAGDAT
eukprot:52284-Eustigmatos_ZCMA.PRE.1